MSCRVLKNKDCIITCGFGPRVHPVTGARSNHNGVDVVGEGMLAVYRPIDQVHEGTKEDPIPFVYGMDTEEGKYYAYEGITYLCKQDMIPCVWPPNTPGLWQWEVVA